MRNEETKENLNIIPLNVDFPKKLKLNKNTRFFIFFPNFKDFELTDGKNYENGFYSIALKDMSKTQIIKHSKNSNFSFLLIYKSNTETEIVSNTYYNQTNLISGPFITANYQALTNGNVKISAESFSQEKDIIFEIEGAPNNAIILNAKPNGNDYWESTPNKAKDLEITFPNNNIPHQLYITITAFSKSTPNIKTSFNLIINIKERNGSYHKYFNETKIDANKIMKESGIDHDKYILQIKNTDPNICIKNANKLDNKWILHPKYNKTIIIENFDLTRKNLDLTLDFIAIKNKSSETNNYTKKIKCTINQDIKNQKLFTKCIACESHHKCKLFWEFMDYVGSSTILKHVAQKSSF